MICKQEFPELETAVPFFDLLLAVVVRILDCSEAQALLILERRALKREHDAVEEAEILDDRDFEDNIDSRDLKTVREARERENVDGEAQVALRQYTKRRRSLPPAPGGKGEGKGKGNYSNGKNVLKRNA